MLSRVTTFDALKNSGAKPGDVVVIQGVGGLGHLAIQYAKKMGFKTIAISRGVGKREFAKRLGAQIFIDTESADVTRELQKLGGAKVILATFLFNIDYRLYSIANTFYIINIIHFNFLYSE